MPASGLTIGVLRVAWGTYGTAAANVVLAAAMLRPDVIRRQTWLITLLGSTAGMATCFVAAPAAIVAVGPGSPAERIQIAGGYQLTVGLFGLLAGRGRAHGQATRGAGCSSVCRRT
jgi:hypothetical protein